MLIISPPLLSRKGFDSDKEELIIYYVMSHLIPILLLKG